MRTTSLKLNDLNRKWYVIDCTDKVIGRISTEVSRILQGKNKPNYAPNLDNGDHIILINTSKLKWTGRKADQKLYTKHTGYQGGLKQRSLEWMMNRNPNVVIEHSVYKMLPKSRMRDVYMAKLHCYADADHKHQAQQPEVLELK